MYKLEHGLLICLPLQPIVARWAAPDELFDMGKIINEI